MHDQDALVRSPAIREWARDNGYRCSARGRLRSDIVQAYAKAHGENISALRGPSRRLEAARVQDAEEAYLQENTG
jgi:tRNA 2-selenouridine synthase SelU